MAEVALDELRQTLEAARMKIEQVAGQLRAGEPVVAAASGGTSDLANNNSSCNNTSCKPN